MPVPTPIDRKSYGSPRRVVSGFVKAPHALSHVLSTKELIFSHTRMEVPMHARALVGATHLAAILVGCRPHAGHRLHLQR